MSITWFYIISIALIIFLNLKKYKNKIIYYFIFLILGACGISTIYHYIFPKEDQNYFNNTDYHILEHLGYEFENELNLANEKNPEYALWDQELGLAKLQPIDSSKSQIVLENFFEPFYGFNSQKKVFELKNAVFELPIKEKLEFKKDGKKLVSLFIEQKKSKYNYILHFNKDTFLLDFHARLNVGYPFLDFISQNEKITFKEDFIDLFENCYLVRSEIKRSKEANRNNGSNLYFIGSKNLHQNENISISNGEKNFITVKSHNTKFNFELNNNQLFYIGLGNSASPKMKVCSNPEANSYFIKFDFPPKVSLRDKKKNNLFIHSDYKDVVNNALTEGFLFSNFKTDNSKNHINASLKYFQGNAREKLKFKIIDQFREAQNFNKKNTFFKGSNEIFDLTTQNKKNNFKWKFQINNLRENCPLQSNQIVLFLICYILIVLCIFSFLNFNSITRIEISIYTIVFALLVLRMILLWRISVFPPLEDIEKPQFDLLRSFSHFRNTVLLTFGFLAARFLFYYKNHLLRILKPTYVKLKNKFKNVNRINRIIGKIFYSNDIMYYIIGYVILNFLCSFPLWLFDLKRIYSIFLPIVFYFLFEYFNAKRNLILVNYRLKINFFNLFNKAFCFFWLVLFDAGFSIVFLLFILFTNIVQLVKFSKNNSREKKIKFTQVSINILLFIGIILWGSELISLLLLNPESTYYSFLTFAIIVTIFMIWNYKLSNIKHWKYFSLPIVILILGFGLSFFIIPKIDSFSYVKYRAEVNQKPLDDLIQQEKFNSNQVNYILRAAQNQWFINTYINADKKLDERDYKRKNSNFRLKPHFAKGSSYTTQALDLVVTRYVISEHSELLVWLIILMLIFISLFIIAKNNVFDSKNTIVSQALNLLLITAFFVWLTSTNRFIFFGQDFPMLSLLSILTLVFTYFLFFLVLIFAKKGKGKLKFFHLIPFLVLLFLFIFLNRTSKQNIIKESNFNINKVLTESLQDFDFVNEKFEMFQLNFIEDAKNNWKEKSKFNTDIFLEKIDLNRLVNSFKSSEEFPKKFANSKFSQSVFDYFISNSNKRNNRNILHLIRVNGLYRFAMNNSYFLVKPPEYQQDNWEGNLYGAKREAGFAFVNTQDRNSIFNISNEDFQMQISKTALGVGNNTITCAVLPSDWFLDENEPVVLINTNKRQNNNFSFSLVNSEWTYNTYDQDFGFPCIRLMPNDFLNIYQSKRQAKKFVKQVALVENNTEVLMKNIWLNGKRRFFYPMKDKFVWAYNYANAINSTYSNSLEKTKSVKTSIDNELTENILKIVNKYAEKNEWKHQEFALSILNGEGKIRTMLDYSYKNRLNPNDLDNLQKIRRKNYLNRNSSTGQNEKGNLNLLKLYNGTGSSIKPIMYAAISSQFNLGWENLKLMASRTNDTILNDENEIVYFGGKKIKAWDLNANEYNNNINNKSYLIYSKNLYHALTMFLGSYSKRELMQLKNEIPNNLNENSVLKQYKYNLNNFPVIQLNSNTNLTFNENHWPKTDSESEEYFGNINSVLATGLNNNFDLEITRPNSEIVNGIRYDNFDSDTFLIFNNSNLEHRNWSYPAFSNFYQEDRSETKLFIKGLKQSTVGGSPIELTPIRMAELTGKLFSFNPEFKMTLSDDSIPKRNEIYFSEDESWKGKYFDFYQKNIISSLEKVILQGTANNILSKHIVKNNAKKIENRYSYYAKTGTTNDQIQREIRGRENDRILMLVISKNDLSKIKKEDLVKNKMYALYFVCYECDTVPTEMYLEILESVEESYLFKQHFK